VWVDRVHFNVRLEDDRLCTLVMIGVRPDGTKELITVEDATARALRAGRPCSGS
jgi:putative transposase